MTSPGYSCVSHAPRPEAGAERNRILACLGAALAGAFAAYALRQDMNREPLVPEAVTEALGERLSTAAEGLLDADEGNHLVNWSNTHECRPKRFHQPETPEELEAIVADAHAKGGRQTPCATLLGCGRPGA